MADVLTELKEKRHSRAVAARTILDAAESRRQTTNEGMTDDERSNFDRISDEIDTLDSDIKRHERAKALGEAQPGGAEHIAETDEERAANAEADKRRLEGAGGVEGLGSESRTANDLAEYRKLTYGGVPQDKDAFRTAFYRYMTATMNELRGLSGDEFRVLSTATNPGGGYIVPATFEKSLLTKAREFGVMRDIASVMSTATGERITQPVEGTHGVATWLGTNVAYSESDESFDVLTLDAYKCGTLMRVAEELLQDASFDLEAYIARQYAARIGILENTAYVLGDGVGKPTGIVTSAAVATTLPAGNTVGFTTATAGDYLVRHYHSVIQAYRNRGAWLMRDATVLGVRLIKDGQGQYIWRPGLDSDRPDTLLGRPLYTDPDMPAMAVSSKAVLFGDFSYYVIRDVAGVGIQRLVELYAGNGQVGFRGYHRTEGKLVNVDAVKALAMSAT